MSKTDSEDPTRTAPSPRRPRSVLPRSETVDRYLETIYYIAAEETTVRPSRIAAWIGVSQPTVSVALQRMVRDGWVVSAPDRTVALTKAGSAVATAIVRRHRLLERWLTDVLGFDWVAADAEAERLAGAMSDAVLDRLDMQMGYPSTCPHGNVVPGRKPPYHGLIALSELSVNSSARIRRVSEVAEHEGPQFLEQLSQNGIGIGREVCLLARNQSPKDVTLQLRIGKEDVPVNSTIAERIWVEPIR